MSSDSLLPKATKGQCIVVVDLPVICVVVNCVCFNTGQIPLSHVYLKFFWRSHMMGGYARYNVFSIHSRHRDREKSRPIITTNIECSNSLSTLCHSCWKSIKLSRFTALSINSCATCLGKSVPASSFAIGSIQLKSSCDLINELAVY